MKFLNEILELGQEHDLVENPDDQEMIELEREEQRKTEEDLYQNTEKSKRLYPEKFNAFQKTDSINFESFQFTIGNESQT